MCLPKLFDCLCVATIHHRVWGKNERRLFIQCGLYGVDTRPERLAINIAKMWNEAGPRNHIVGSAVAEGGSDNFSSAGQRQRGHRKHMAPETAIHANSPLHHVKF